MATQEDTVKTATIGTLVAVLALSVIVVALAVTAMVRSDERSLETARDSAANLGPVRELKTGQLAKLSAAPTFVDKAKGIVSVPIELAMKLEVESARKEQMAVPELGPSASETAVHPADAGSAPPPKIRGGGPEPASRGAAPREHAQ